MFALGLRLASLGSGTGRAKIFSVTAFFGLRRILRRHGTRLISIRVQIDGTPRAIVVSDYGELEVMRDIFLDEDYSVEGLPVPKTILDVGANIGLAALYFRACYPDAQIIAVEPDPTTFFKLTRNVGGDGRVLLVNAAASDHDGEVVLFQPAAYSIASSVKRSEGAASEVRVRATTLDALCDEMRLSRIDMLKLDVEGAEVEALEGFARLSEVQRVLAGEQPVPALAVVTDPPTPFPLQGLSSESQAVVPAPARVRSFLRSQQRAHGAVLGRSPGYV